MTDHEQPSGGNDVHALSGAYAVDALDEGERVRFEEHLRQCAECRAEVASLQEAAAALATDDVAPPASVRDRVLAGIDGIRPLPPVVGAGDHPEPSDELAARRRLRRAPLASRLPLLVAAAAVVLLLGVLVPRLGLGDDERPAPPTVAEQVLAATDATRVEKHFPDGAEAVVVVSRKVGHAVIQTRDMAPPPEGEDYQLWLQTPSGEMQPAGVMPDVRDSTTVLVGDASRATGVGITVEPDGGSKQPTSEPIAFFTLES